MRQVWTADQVFDGDTLRLDHAVIVEDGVISALVPVSEAPQVEHRVDLGAGVLSPGFVDLQVNGGGGALLGQGDPAEALRVMCHAHGLLGTTALLPTLITSPRAVMFNVLAAAGDAVKTGLPGFAGLHLEGPFLDPMRCGAHDPGLIRPMEDADLSAIIAAAQVLPVVMITVAPESVSVEQIKALEAAGVLVSLGHSGTDEASARDAMQAGARAVTHLFNAMSPLTHRAPGLVGAALDSPVWAGIIPDGVHVSPTAFRIALQAKPGRMFAVSDAMAVAGTDHREFQLNGRRILRSDGQLTLPDGTLAGADISLPQAVAWMVQTVGVDLATALAMVTSIPAQVIGQPKLGRLAPGAPADLVHLDEAMNREGVWRAGRALN